MKPHFLSWTSSLMLLVLAGCHSPDPAPNYFSEAASLGGKSRTLFAAGPVPTDAPSPLPLPSDISTDLARSSDTAQPIRQVSWQQERQAEPTVPLQLTDAINLALARNPDLTAARAAEPVAHAALHVANTYPWNPQFQTQIAPYSRDRDGNDGAIAQQHVLVQTFELGHQRRFRVGAASANWGQVIGTIQQAELLNAAQTTRLFFAALYEREMRDMSRSLADLNGQLVGVMQRREEAGQAGSADVNLACLEAQSSRRQHRLAETSYQTALVNLRNQLNLAPNAPLELADQWAQWRWQSLDEVFHGKGTHVLSESTDDRPGHGQSRADTTPLPQEYETILRQLVMERPDVAAARAAVAMARENLYLANAMRRPDVQIGPMWQRDEASTEFWGIQAQIDIPIVNTGKPLVAQRSAELRQQQITATQLETRAYLEASAAVQRYQRAQHLVDQSRDELVCEIPEALTPFDDQFKAGQITLLEVFAARAALVQSRQSLLDLWSELALSAADVMQATGLPAQQLLTTTEPQLYPLEEVPRP